ncbi:unnamed protein product [Urochloa humidicola]
MSTAARRFPKWALLELYTFRRDDDDSFPDESEAPIRASGVTTLGAHFRIAFSIVKPPRISRLYAQLPGFPGPDKAEPLTILATHRHLALLIVGSRTPSSRCIVQNFIFRVNEKNPSSSSLKVLPTCNEPKFDYPHGDDRPRPRPSYIPRLLSMLSLGLWCGDEEEFVVAELTVIPTIGRRRTKAFADLCLLRSSFTDDQLAGAWSSMHVEILSPDDPAAAADDDLWKLSSWQTNTSISFQRWLCWIDYRQGILFCDVSNKVLAPTVSFLWFPRDKSSPTSTHKTSYYGHGGVSVVNRGRTLKFVNVTCHDGLSYAPLTSFTITCHILVFGGGSMAWKEDYTVTSDELWDANPPDRLPHGSGLMFPQVDVVRPHVVHFLYVESGHGAYEKLSVVSIDMNTKKVESFYLYLDGNKFLRGDDDCPADDTDFIITKSTSPSPTPFFPCEFSRFCRLSRKRKNME